jgi:hypothetical protein
MRFAARFEGPPGAANGGVVAGTLAGDGPAEVVIRRPVPVEAELRLEGRELLGADGELLAAATPADPGSFDALAAAVPRVSPADARAAAAATPLADGHPFPGCFGCGPGASDGIHCLAGPVGDGVWAVDWTPQDVSAPFVWAALDCPSSAPVVPVDGQVPHVLGRIAGRVLAPLRAGEPHVVVAWKLGEEGRRKHSASVILGPGGTPHAVARATWVALRLPG